MSRFKKVLISTIQPVGGGVPAMVRSVVDILREQQCEITIVYYEPYSVSPHASIPFYKLPFRRHPEVVESTFYGCKAIGIGCWFPELEFTNYWLNRYWNEIIDQHDVYMTVSGSCLAALPFLQKKVPFVAWVASDWKGDRVNRVKTFPWYRRIFDAVFVSPFSQHVEKKIILSQKLVALSDYTKRTLNESVAQNAVLSVLDMAVDTEYFSPRKSSKVNYSIGFVGRFGDPRKNIGLLIDSAAKICKEIPDMKVFLVGDQLSNNYVRQAEKLGVMDNLVIYPYLSKQDLVSVLKQLDVFILPSYQEGLCIAAIEAMSCSVPVVSTRCGGPEAFIHDGVNGVFVESNSDSMSAAVLNMYSNDAMRIQFAQSARKSITELFSKEAHANRLLGLLNAQFNSAFK